MKIPLNARVQCMDGPDGHAVQVIVNPITKKITHVVVEERRLPHIERLVPIALVLGTGEDVISLACSRQELGKMTPLIESEFLERVERRGGGGTA